MTVAPSTGQPGDGRMEATIMGWRMYCLECEAIVGEGIEEGDADRGPRLALCQSCAQHGGRRDLDPGRDAPEGTARELPRF
jgi:hypothetical protein